MVDVCLWLAAAGLGITVGLGMAAERWSEIAAPGGGLLAFGRMTGLVGTYLMLVVILIASRIPVVERTLGQDRLTRWHRALAPWSLILIVAHVLLVTAGYARGVHAGFVGQLGQLVTAFPGMLAATVGFVLLVIAGISSTPWIRRRLRYETWWAIHLYIYLGLALSFSHQLAIGAAFLDRPLARAWWTAVWFGTAGTVVSYRFVLPIWRTALHRLRVVAVVPAAPGVVSIVLKGCWLERLPLSGGQFIQWRFLQRGLWWQAHPYSVSALAHPPYLRLTVKAAGDHSAALASIAPGTWVAIEGPYGAFTSDARHGDRVALIGAAVGITPLRALLEDLPPHVDAVMVVRGRRREDVILRDELYGLIRSRRSGRLHELIGSREQAPLTELELGRLIPDLAQRDVYICGPNPFTLAMREISSTLGVPEERIHHETFAF